MPRATTSAASPSHPHRGFETVTIMLEGRMRHHDSVGNVGLLEPGSVQWMTAGRGILHSEMPEQEEGRMAGFQLWVNLAAADKMRRRPTATSRPAPCPSTRRRRRARARHRRRERWARRRGRSGRRPSRSCSTSRCRPGASFDARACRRATTPSPTSSAATPRSTSAATRHRRSSRADGDPRQRRRQPTACASRAASSREPARVLLVAGRPLGEPIAQYGPFVMNTTAELQQAVADFQRGTLAA